MFVNIIHSSKSIYWYYGKRKSCISRPVSHLCTAVNQSPESNEKTERLQKFLSQCGVASRRHAEHLISSGKVTCNGVVVTTLGTKIDPEKDVISVNGSSVMPRQSFRWVMINKPLGVLSTSRDDHRRKTVCDLIPGTRQQGLVPVGRLDQASTGLLLLSNELHWFHKLLHPKYGHSKEYIVRVQGRVHEKTLDRLRRGILLPGEDTMTTPAVFKAIAVYDNYTYVRVVLKEGRKRQIRRMFLAVGHPVLSLERIRFGSLTLPKNLKPGQWRDLTVFELDKLKRGISSSLWKS
eukprot:jgi/Galph1/5768/GphlegSOOS_G4382.1